MPLEIVNDPLPLRVDAEGVVRVGPTRVPLDTVVGAFQDGAAAEEIVMEYTSLELADVYAVIGYYLRHKSEVEAYLEERRQQSERVRRENEARSDMTGIRERLLARRNQAR